MHACLSSGSSSLLTRLTCRCASRVKLCLLCPAPCALHRACHPAPPHSPGQSGQHPPLPCLCQRAQNQRSHPQPIRRILSEGHRGPFGVPSLLWSTAPPPRAPRINQFHGPAARWCFRGVERLVPALPLAAHAPKPPSLTHPQL